MNRKTDDEIIDELDKLKRVRHNLMDKIFKRTISRDQLNALKDRISDYDQKIYSLEWVMGEHAFIAAI